MHWLPREMQLRNVRFNVVPVKTNSKKKEVRIRGLSNYFQAGQIYFFENQHDLIEEFDRFGATEDIHLLDALAYGPEIWRPALNKQKWEDYKKAEEEYLKAHDPVTGYSEI
jgi:hypothetical protein